MATIGANSLASGNTSAANPFSGLGANGAAGAAGAATESSAPDTFMRLVTGMIQGNTSHEQLPANLVDFLLTGDTQALEGFDLDTSDTSSDDEDGEDAEALALAGMLAGLQPIQPAHPAHAGSAANDANSAIDAAGRRGGDALQMLLGASQDHLAAALEGAGDDATAFAATATQAAGEASAAAGAQPNSASHMQSLLLAHRAAEAAPQAASVEVRTPVGSPGWSDEIGTHLTMMAANGREAASLKLSPEHLGPLEVRISMKDGEASVFFGASNPDTRSALEQSLPRLREMFASQGLVLGDANVSRDAQRDHFRPATFANATRGSSDAGSEADVTAVTLSRMGLVDTYV